MKIRRLILAIFAIMLAASFTGAPALAGGSGGGDPSAKCNSGRGNDSETTPETDCDPGNSGGHNQGGD
jgi:hypothetical protein